MLCVCRQQPQLQQPELQEQQRQEQLEQANDTQHPELGAATGAAAGAAISAATCAVRDQAWPKQHAHALQLLQARINEYGQHGSSGSKGSSILQLEPELLQAGPAAEAGSAACDGDDDEEEVWRMLPDAVFVDVYNMLPPAAQG